MAAWAAAGIFLAWTLADLDVLEPAVLARGFENLGVFMGDLVPPDTDHELVTTLAKALWETLQMAYVGTLLGAALGLPLAVLAARPIAGPTVSRAMRLALAFVRTVPSLLWALVFTVAFGLGPLAGILGLAVYTVGYLGKLYYESLEGLDPDVLEAVSATGANRLQLVRHAAIPEAANALVSHLLYAFEYNVRASSILGFVGAGGIGIYLVHYMSVLEYQKVTTAVLMLLALVVAIDGASRFVRKRFLLQADGAAGPS